MKTSGTSRGSAWCSRCLRASSVSTVTPATSRGRQCSTNTWTSHSSTGKSRDQHDRHPTGRRAASRRATTRATSVPTSVAVIIHGDGWRQNAAEGATEGDPLRRTPQRGLVGGSARRRAVLSTSVSVIAVSSSRASIASIRSRGGDREQVVCALAGLGRRRRSAMASARASYASTCSTSADITTASASRTGSYAARMLLNISRNVIESAPSTTWLPEGQRVLLAAYAVVVGREGAARRPAVRRRSRRLGPRPRRARRSWGRRAAGPRGCERATARSSSPPVTSSRGSRSSPPSRRKSRTVVEPPCRTSTRPAWPAAAGPRGPRAGRRRAPRRAVARWAATHRGRGRRPVTSATSWSKTSSGTERRCTG